MKAVTFKIGDKVVENYEAVYRTTSKQKNMPVDGSDVIPIIKYKEKPT